MAWALDLDGVVWRGDEGVPGRQKPSAFSRTPERGSCS